MQAKSSALCPAGTFTLPVPAVTLPRMDDSPHTRPIHATRWDNFRRLLADRKLTVTAAALALQKPQGQVSHFGGKRPTKIIGDQIAAEIEVAFSLPVGWLDERPEPFITDDSPSQGNDVRQSRVSRPDVPILAEAVEVITVDEATNGLYSFTKHAALLLDLCDQLESGKTKTELVAKLTKQRSQGEGKDGLLEASNAARRR